jgi:hypothetical protein
VNTRVLSSAVDECRAMRIIVGTSIRAFKPP